MQQVEALVELCDLEFGLTGVRFEEVMVNCTLLSPVLSGKACGFLRVLPENAGDTYYTVLLHSSSFCTRCWLGLGVGWNSHRMCLI